MKEKTIWQLLEEIQQSAKEIQRLSEEMHGLPIFPGGKTFNETWKSQSHTAEN